MTKGKPQDQDAAGAASDAARRVQSVRGTKGDEARAARVKAALKANIARRKAQAKARSDSGDEDE